MRPAGCVGEALARSMFPVPAAFTEPDAVLAGRLFTQTRRRSRSLADCMIAAVAIRCGTKLATINVADIQLFTAHGLIRLDLGRDLTVRRFLISFWVPTAMSQMQADVPTTATFLLNAEV